MEGFLNGTVEIYLHDYTVPHSMKISLGEKEKDEVAFGDS